MGWCLQMDVHGLAVSGPGSNWRLVWDQANPQFWEYSELRPSKVLNQKASSRPRNNQYFTQFVAGFFSHVFLKVGFILEKVRIRVAPTFPSLRLIPFYLMKENLYFG